MYQKSTNQCYNSGTFRTYGFLLNAKPKISYSGKNEPPGLDHYANLCRWE